MNPRIVSRTRPSKGRLKRARRALEDKEHGELPLKRTRDVIAFERLIQPVLEREQKGTILELQERLGKKLVGRRVPPEIVPRMGGRHLLYRSGRFRGMREQPWKTPPKALGRFHQVSVSPEGISLHRAGPKGFERLLVCSIEKGGVISGVTMERRG